MKNQNKRFEKYGMVLFDLLLIISVFISYCDSHNMMPELAVSGETALNSMISGYQAGTLILAIIPYGIVFTVIGLNRLKRVRMQHPKRYAVILIASLIVTLCIKYAYFMTVIVHGVEKGFLIR